MPAAESYPDDLRYHPEHDWARIDGDEATLGITWFAQDALGELVHYEAPEPGSAVTKDESYGEVESVKAVSDVVAPLSGEVLDVNRRAVDEPEVVNDAVGGLRSGSEDMIGVSVVIGTHVAIAGRNAGGDLFHLGFWPDSTGAHALGSQGLAAIWRHMLGLGPETSLIGRALARWNASDPEELLHLLTRIGAPEDTQAARFADAVLDEADEGDPVAATIVETAAGRMGDYARVCAERTGQLGAPFSLVICGSVLRHPSPLLRSALLARVPDGRPVYPHVEPVAGAVLLAADRFHIKRVKYFAGGPHVAEEIRSPGDESQEKLPFYASLNILEVWIIDRD